MFEPWQHFFAVKLNHSLLICLARMNIHDPHSAVEELGHGLEVNGRICPQRPVAIDLFERYFGIGALLNFLRVANAQAAANTAALRRSRRACGLRSARPGSLRMGCMLFFFPIPVFP